MIYQVVLGFHHVLYRDSFCDTNHQRNACIGSFHDRVCRKCRRNENDGYIRTRCLYSIRHGIEYRALQVAAAAFAGVTPPTTLVPYSIICVAWKVPSVPVNPCTITLLCLFTKTLIALDLINFLR